MEGVPGAVALARQVLIELAHWIGRAMQYSPSHPASVELAQRVHATLSRALEGHPQLVYGILKDDVMIGEQPVAHPAVRARIAAHLHDRGVLVLRFLHGVNLEDLQGFLELVLLPPQTIFDLGGMQKLTLDKRIARVQVEDLAHEISAEQLESGRRRQRLRSFFNDALRNLLARRDLDISISERLAEMLEHPEVTVTILEDQGHGVAEAAAGLALMVQQEEQRTGQPLSPQLRAIFAALAPMARDRLVLGFPPLVGELRGALAWAMRGYREQELAGFVFPAVRVRAHELDVVLYALSVLVPHDGTRLSTLRKVGLMLHDLPLDDAVADQVLGAIARPVEDFESYRRERLCLVDPAGRAREERSLAALALAPEPPTTIPPLMVHAGGAIREVVAMAARTRQFERFCRRMPDAASALAAHGSGPGLFELVGALASVDRPEWRELCARTIATIASLQAAELLAELETRDFGHKGNGADERVALARMIAMSAPRPVLDHLDRAQNQPLRRLLLEHLPLAGPRLRSLLRAKLTADAAPTVVDLLALLPRVEGRSEDLVEVARHRDENVRLEVVRALRSLPPDEKAMDLVVRYLADPSPQVRVAVRLLVRGDLLGPTAIAGIGRILDDAAQTEEVHRRLVQALGQSRHDAAAQLLFHVLQPHGLIEVGQGALRELTAAQLAHSPAPAAARYFKEGLESPLRRVRKACEKAATRGGA